MYLCPFEDVGRGPIMSHVSFQMDSGLQLCLLDLEELGGLCFWQDRHDRTQFSTSSSCPGQLNCSFTFSRVSSEGGKGLP